MIVEAIEGKTAFNQCLLRSVRCPNSKWCRLYRALSEAQTQFLEVFEDWTLADLVVEAHRRRFRRPSAQVAT
jgi:DNA-binding IscR family transcriptional regulator